VRLLGVRVASFESVEATGPAETPDPQLRLGVG